MPSRKPIPSSLQQIWQATNPYLSSLFLLVMAFMTSLTIAPLLTLPFKNPFEISNPFNSVGFNPDNNYAYILIVIAITILGYYSLRYLYSNGWHWLIKIIVIAILAANFFLVNSLNTPGFTTGPNGLDNFHSGEILSPSAAFLSGVNPYSEMIFLRGAGVDVIIPAISYLITGKSIGSILLQIDFLMILSMVSFLLLLAFLIRNSVSFGVIAILFYISDAVSLLHFRDIPVWIVMGLTLLLFKKGVHKNTQKILLFSIGVVSSLSLFVAIDKGVLLFGTAVVLGILYTFLRVDGSNNYQFSARTWLQNSIQAIPLWAGLLLGLFAPAIFLGIDGFMAFVKLTFFEIPQFGGLLVSQPFPGLFTEKYAIWGAVFVTIACIILLITMFRLRSKHQLNALLPLFLFLIIGILCIKAGANRIDVTKMASVITPLFLAAGLIAVHALRLSINDRNYRTAILGPLLLLCGILILFSQLDIRKLLYQPSYSRSQLKSYARMPYTPDSKWISSETQAVKNYVVSHTDRNDYIFAFTSDPIYYYLTDRKNPSRFYVSWFADPQPYTTELLNALKARPPKIIIYEEKTWMDQPDTVPMQVRIPEVDSWIKTNYQKHVTIGSTTLLEK